MYGQIAPVFRGQRGHGLNLGKAGAGGVIQPQRDARRTRLQRPCGNARHGEDLCRARARAGVGKAHGLAQRKGMPHQLGLIQHIAGALLPGEPFLKIERRKPAVAPNGGGNALHHRELPRIRVAVQMAVYVDKAGRNDQPRGIHHALRRQLVRGNVHDPAALNGHVGKAGCARAHIHHTPAHKAYVNHRFPPCGSWRPPL